MKLWKEILIQYALIIGIFNIIVYTNSYGSSDTYICLILPMTIYMVLIPAYISSINKTNRTLIKRAILKLILPLIFVIYNLICSVDSFEVSYIYNSLIYFIPKFEMSYIYKSLMYFIPGLTTLVINLYIAHRQKKNDNFKH